MFLEDERVKLNYYLFLGGYGKKVVEQRMDLRKGRPSIFSGLGRKVTPECGAFKGRIRELEKQMNWR